MAATLRHRTHAYRRRDRLGGTRAGHDAPMLINELTDLDCEACGEAVDVLAADFEPIEPLLCDRCLTQLKADDAEERLPIAA